VTPDSREPGGPVDPEASVGLTIQHVSQLLMVPAPTIRSWERRYGVPVASRSTGGHRRYTHEELHLLRRMRDDIARGHPAAEAAARLSRNEIAAAAPLVEQFLESAHRLDSDGVRDALDSALRSFGLDVTVDAVLLPAMRELGRWWEVGRCDIAHEQLATDLCRTWLAEIATIESDVEQHGPVVLTCGPRDFHSVGLDAMAAMLRQRGWACLMLGVLTPVESLRLAVHESDAVAVVLVSHLSMARRSSVEALRSVQRPRTRLFYAGNAFLTRQARYGVRGTYLGTNLSQAADLISAYVAAEYDGEGLTA
jgi:DNA-binding transcriptional MerR regulator/methylmalonyl-CoA mutase cobalamin-binding subunit